MVIPSQYCAYPSLVHCNLVVSIFQNLAGILELGIKFKSDKENELVRYTNSDMARLKDRLRLISRYAFLFLEILVFY